MAAHLQRLDRALNDAPCDTAQYCRLRACKTEPMLALVSTNSLHALSLGTSFELAVRVRFGNAGHLAVISTLGALTNPTAATV